jgi:hypothetical protein
MDAAAPEALELSETVEATPELLERSQWLNLPTKRSRWRAARKTKRRWLRVKLPTSVVVTLVGIGLTAWLFPAFTRQWDDRQKVAELKASLVADMALTTGRALADAQSADATGRALAAVRAPASSRVSRPQPIPGPAKDWFGASLQIRGRLLAYFGHAAVERWELITKFVTATMRAAYPSSNIPLLDAKLDSPRLESAYAAWAFGSVDEFDDLQRAILSEEDQVAASLRGMHVSGYSTRWRDVVHDLLPF